MVIFVTDLDYIFWTFSVNKMMSRFVTKNCDFVFANERDFSQLSKCLEQFFFVMDHDF